MQRLELSPLASLSGSQRDLIKEGQPMIFEIIVTETQDTEKRTKESQD